MRSSLLLFLFFLLNFHLSAQELLWEKNFGGNDIDWLQYAFENSSGNYVFSGYSYSGISGDKSENSRGHGDFWIIETDKSGQIVWQITLGGNLPDMIHKILEFGDGSYVLAGTSYSGISGEKTSPNHGARDLWLVKLAPDRQITWQHNYGGNGTEVLNDIISTRDGGFLVVAHSNSDISGEKTATPLGDYDLWVLKLNSAGDQEWQKSFGGSGIEIDGKVHQTPKGHYVIAANSSSGISGNKTVPAYGFLDYWLFEIDPAGDLLWQKSFGGNNADTFTDMIPTADGGYLLGGDTSSEVSGNKTIPMKSMVDLWLIKTDSRGEPEWQRSYGGDNHGVQWMAQINQTEGGFLIGAMSASGIGNDKTEPNRGDRDFWMLRINEHGAVCWDKTLGGDSLDQPHTSFEDSEGNFVVGGWTDSDASGDKSGPSKGGRDFWVTKISQPIMEEPRVNVTEPIQACDMNGDGFTDFDTSRLEEQILEGQGDLEVSYFDETGRALEIPFPATFTNTVRDRQIISVRLRDKKIRCLEKEFDIIFEVTGCPEGPSAGNADFPTFFTPNGDGHNDTWKAQTSTGISLKAVHIYDRYGKLLVELKPGGEWDGRSRGKLMPTDDYWYHAVTDTNELITGHFSLIR